MTAPAVGPRAPAARPVWLVLIVVTAALLASGCERGAAESERVQPAVLAQRMVEIRELVAPVDVEMRVLDELAWRDALMELGLSTRRHWGTLTTRLLEGLGAVEPGWEQDAPRASETVRGLYLRGGGEILVLELSDPHLEEMVLAHEYAHALQEAAGLTHAGVAAADDERSARSALIEGDADLAARLYAERWLASVDLERIEREQQKSRPPTHFPPAVSRLLRFPYEAGVPFVDELFEIGGFERVNEAFLDPPRTSEQVLHLDKYLAHEAPIAVPEPDLGTLSREELDRREIGSAGEFALRTWIAAMGGDEDEAERAAAGWGGDAFALTRTATGEPLAALRVVWDDPDRDAAEFNRALELALDGTEGIGRLPPDEPVDGEVGRWRMPHSVLALVSPGGRESLVIVAPDESRAGQILEAAGAG